MTDGDPRPLDGLGIPRFGEIATFMRLPVIRDAGRLDIALIGVPWDGGTTNRAGARHGPREIRNMSTLMRERHPVGGGSPYEVCRCGDLGDAPVNPIDLMGTIERLSGFYAGIVQAGAVPLSAGGDHLMSLPILRGVAEHRPVALIQFDSHADTNDAYFGANRYTHGTPFRRAVEEGLIDAGRSIQVGLRGSMYSVDDAAFSRAAGMRVVTIEEYFDLGWRGVAAEIRRVVGDGPAYLSFDVDSLDPAFAPGTGTPEIGGFSTHEAQQMVRALRGMDLVGADVVEVSPPFDPTGVTALVGATMMFELLCVLAASVKQRGRKGTA